MMFVNNSYLFLLLTSNSVKAKLGGKYRRMYWAVVSKKKYSMSFVPSAIKRKIKVLSFISCDNNVAAFQSCLSICLKHSISTWQFPLTSAKSFLGILLFYFLSQTLSFQATCQEDISTRRICIHQRDPLRSFLTCSFHRDVGEPLITTLFQFFIRKVCFWKWQHTEKEKIQIFKVYLSIFYCWWDLEAEL